ncbi:hypothetical protein [Corynebacterium mastitidis]|nr:hypothetical protein [Corynebacterium mastitidis]MDK8451357.1 hypothetical protein [Corynebacterium mastitidis]
MGDAYRKIDPEEPITIEIEKVKFQRHGVREVKNLFYPDNADAEGEK